MHCVQEVQLDVSFNRDRDEWTFVMMPENLIRDHKDGCTFRPGTLSQCLLDAPYDSLPFLRWSRM